MKCLTKERTIILVGLLSISILFIYLCVYFYNRNITAAYIFFGIYGCHFFLVSCLCALLPVFESDPECEQQVNSMRRSSRIQDEESIDQSLQCGNTSNNFGHRNKGLHSKSHQRGENLASKRKTGYIPLRPLNNPAEIGTALPIERGTSFNDQETLRVTDERNGEKDKLLSDIRSYGSNDSEGSTLNSSLESDCSTLVGSIVAASCSTLTPDN